MGLGMAPVSSGRAKGEFLPHIGRSVYLKTKTFQPCKADTWKKRKEIQKWNYHPSTNQSMDPPSSFFIVADKTTDVFSQAQLAFHCEIGHFFK